MSELIHYTAQQLDLIRRTYGKDLNPEEFDLYVEVSRRRGLSILERHLHAQVFNKKDADKRTLVFVTSIDGARAIAESTGEYRPDDKKPVFIHCTEDAITSKTTNPKGIDSCTVQIYKMDKNGNWFPVIGEARWEEFAKIEYGKLSDTWVKMPYHMLAKCAEMQALRKAFPSQFGGIYTQEESGREEFQQPTNELASEQLRQEQFKAKTAHIPAAGEAIGLLLPENKGVVKQIAIGQVFDTVSRSVREMLPEKLNEFFIVNRESLNTYYKHEPAAAKEIQKIFIQRQEELIKAEQKKEIDNTAKIEQNEPVVIGQTNLI